MIPEAGGMGVADLRTRRSLISRLRDVEDRDSWQDFFDTYWALIFGAARKAGLSEVEAEEVVQETLLAVTRYIGEYRYDPEHCSFKGWLLHKTRWKIIDQVRKRPRHLAAHCGSGAEEDAVEAVPDPRSLDLDAYWEAEWKRNLVESALQRVRQRLNPVHYQIFHLSSVRGFAPRKVAGLLGIGVAQVYLVRHRVAALMKAEVRALEAPPERHE